MEIEHSEGTLSPASYRHNELQQPLRLETANSSFTGRNLSVADTSESKSNIWKQLKPKVDDAWILEKLQQAYRSRDRQGMSDLLNEIETRHSSLKNNISVREAKRGVQILNAALSLKEACDKKDSKEIKKKMEDIKKEGLAKILENELREAMYQLESIRKSRRSQAQLGDVKLDRKTMTEMRRYHVPPPGVHQVMQGVLLLLGEDEETTSSWRTIQRMFSPHGGQSIHRRMLQFDRLEIDLQLAARSKQILLDHDVDKLHQTCPTAASLYIWAMSVIDDIGKDLPEPATTRKQRVILNRASPKAPQMDRSYYHILAKNKRDSSPSKQAYQSLYTKTWNSGDRGATRAERTAAGHYRPTTDSDDDYQMD